MTNLEFNSFGSYNPAIAADFIEKWEGCRLEAYQPLAGDKWTIGVGHTDGVKQGEKITYKKARDLLFDDLAMVAARLARYVNVPITVNQYIALMSLTFNVGICFPKLLNNLNHKRYFAASKEFLDIDTFKGKKVNGLTRRRKAESDLFVTGLSQDNFD